MSRGFGPLGTLRGSRPGLPWWSSSPRPCGSGNAVSRSPTLANSCGQVRQPMSHKMDDLALALDATVDCKHASRQNDPPLLLKDSRPDDEIGDAALVLDGDEHDPFGRTRHLPHQYKSSGLDPAAIACLHRLATGDDAPRVQVGPQKGDGVIPKGQPDVAVILNHLAAGRHRP